MLSNAADESLIRSNPPSVSTAEVSEDKDISPPSKIQKTGNAATDASFSRGRATAFNVTSGTSPSNAMFDASYPLDYLPNDLLPLNYKEVAIASRKRTLNPPKFDLNLLSDDVLGHCLWSGFLGSVETVRVSQASRRFQHMASTQVLRLDLSRDTNLTRSDIVAIVQSFPNLTELDFSYCSQFEGQHLEALKPLRNSLKILGLRGTKVKDLDMVHFLNGMEKLESIDLSAVDKEGSVRIGNSTANALANHCPNLQSIFLAWCKNLEDEGLEALCKLRKLKTIDVSLTGITDCSSLSKLSARVDIDLSATDVTPASMVRLFAKTSSYTTRSLSLRFHQGVSRDLLESFVLHAPFLEFIDLTHSTGTDGEPLGTIVHPYLADYVEKRSIKVQGASFVRTMAATSD